MARVLDLIVLGNDKDLVAESRALATGELTKDTLQVSPDYQDLVLGHLEDFGERQGLVPNAVEFHLDLTTLARNFPAFASWPGEGPDLSQEIKLLRSFVQTKAMRALWGAVDFNDETVSALMTIDMNRNELTPQQSSFYSAEPGDVDRWLRPKLRCIPSTAAGFLLLRVPVQLFLEEFVASLEKDARDLIDEGLRRSGQRGGVRGLIDNFARGLEPYVLVIIRNNDYPKFQTEYEVKIPSPRSGRRLGRRGPEARAGAHRPGARASAAELPAFRLPEPVRDQDGSRRRGAHRRVAEHQHPGDRADRDPRRRLAAR